MAVFWRFLRGGEEGGRSARFADREAAEAWLAGSWEELADAGHDEVELADEEAGALYRMGLGED